MKRLPCLAVVVLLGACAQGSVPHDASAQAPAIPPAGMFKMLEDAEFTSYFDARSLALYQGNPQLRQFYLINNYPLPAAPSDTPPEIRSSRATQVINCGRDQMARFGRVYFSEPFAQGQEVVRKGDIAQWEALERRSLMGTLRDLVCNVDAGRLRAGDSG